MSSTNKIPSKQDIIDCIGNTPRWIAIVLHDKRPKSYIKTCEKLADICLEKRVNTDKAVEILIGSKKEEAV